MNLIVSPACPCLPFLPHGRIAAAMLRHQETRPAFLRRIQPSQRPLYEDRLTGLFHSRRLLPNVQQLSTAAPLVRKGCCGKELTCYCLCLGWGCCIISSCCGLLAIDGCVRFRCLHSLDGSQLRNSTPKRPLIRRGRESPSTCPESKRCHDHHLSSSHSKNTWAEPESPS